LLVSGGEDAKAVVWQVKDGRKLTVFPDHRYRIWSVAYDPLGRFVASGDKGGILKVWDPGTSRVLASREAHQGNTVMGLAFSPNGRRLASAGMDGQLLLWDTASWDIIETWTSRDQPVTSVAYAPDNLRLATTLADGTIQVWKEGRQDPLLTLRGQYGLGLGLAISPDGRRLASGNFDQTVRLWDLETGEPLLALRENVGDVASLVFSPDGQRLTAGNTLGEVLLWFASGLPPMEGTVPKRWVRWYTQEARKCQKVGQGFALAFYCGRLLDAGELYFGLGKDEQVESELSRVLEENRSCRDAWLSRGAVRANLARWGDALEDYNEALKLSDRGVAPWWLRGVAHAELERWDMAVSDFAKAVERAPTSRRDLANLAIAQLGRSDLPAYCCTCIRAYERLHKTDIPSDWNSLSWTCSITPNDAVDPAKLVQLMDRAVKAEPKTYPFLNTRGAVLYRAGRFEDAIRQLEDAIQLHGQGGSFEDHVFLAMARFRLSKMEQARADLKRALELYDEGLKRGTPAADWSRRVEWPLLRKEAEALLQEKKP
jgi:WD40 repeat protein